MKILSILRRYGAPVLVSLLSASYIAQAQIVNPSQPATGVPVAGTGISVTGQTVSVNYGVANSPFTGNLSVGGTLTTATQNASGTTTNTGPTVLNGTVSGTGINAFLASPPAIGSTAAGTGAFTTLANSGTFTSTGAAVLNGAVSGTGIATYEAGINHVQTYATIATLRALPSCIVGSMYADQGYAAVADGGNSIFVCTSDVASADNGGSIIATATNRLYLQSVNNSVSVKQFGAKCDGSTNDQTTISAAFTYANTLGNSVVNLPAATTCKVNSTLTLYPNVVTFEGNGSALDFTSIATATFGFTFSQSVTDPNARPGFNKAHPIRNMRLLGPGGSGNTATAVDASDHNPTSGPNYTIAGVSVQNINFINWYRDVEFGNGAFLWTFFNDQFNITGGTGFDSILLVDSATNNGENLEFIGCFFGKSSGRVVQQNNPNASLFFKGSSADYNQQIVNSVGGYIEWDGYIESNTDTAYWVTLTGANTVVRIAGEVVVTNSTAKTAFEFFNVDSTVTNGGLLFDASLQFASGAYSVTSQNMVAGTGRVLWNYRASSNNTVHPAIGGSTNNLWNGGFENANIAEWTLTGTTPPARSLTVAHSGTWSLGFLGSLTNTPTASKQIKCLPGQQMTGGVWYQAPVLTGTGGTAFIGVNYLDSSGTASLQGATIVGITASLGTWTYARISQLTPAPVGTAIAALTVDIFGTTSGAPTMYIDDVQITCN